MRTGAPTPTRRGSTAPRIDAQSTAARHMTTRREIHPRLHRLGHGSNTSKGENVRVTKGLQISAVITASVLLAAACSSSKKSTASPATSAAPAPTASSAPAATTAAAPASTPAAPASSAAAGGGGLIGLDIPRSDTPFWAAYIKYVPQEATKLGA